jgi:o-succinylbenzoate synthase
MKATVKKLDLQFIHPGQTSRGTLHSKPSWFIILEDYGRKGIGECSVIPELNPEYSADYESKIHNLVAHINNNEAPELAQLDHLPSIRFGYETALINLQNGQEGILFPSEFTEGVAGIPINGLIWMGNKEEMRIRIKEKLENGFGVLKLKVGSLEFEQEITLLHEIRSAFGSSDLEIRLDANGAFTMEQAAEKLKRLSDFQIHSIEQPIKAGQWDDMAELCLTSPLPIALDEELIGIFSLAEKQQLLEIINPQYIILKPSLLGGLDKSIEWIELAEKKNINWWATSALESNIGLNAIAQWVFTLKPAMVQGLGTGQVFSNNISSPLELKGNTLYYNIIKSWGYHHLIT